MPYISNESTLKFENILKVQLNYGRDNPLVIDCKPSTQLVEIRGPEGVDVDASAALVRDALLKPVAGPPLPDHVVPGDKVVIAQAGNLPGGQLLSDAIYLAILESLQAGGVSLDDIQRVTAPPTIQLDDQYPTVDSSSISNQT